MKKIITGAAAALFSLSLVSCGDSATPSVAASEAESDSAAIYAGPMLSNLQSSGADASGASFTQQGVAQRFMMANQTILAEAECDDLESKLKDPNVTCTVNKCEKTDTGGAVDVSCVNTDPASFTCGDTTYSADDSTFTIKLDVTGTGAATKLAFNIGLTSTPTGGELKGLPLICSVVYDFTIAALALNGDNLYPTADEVSCTYAGKIVDKTKLLAKYKATDSCAYVPATR